MLFACSSRSSSWITPRIPSSSRNYAISMTPSRPLPGAKGPRVFKGQKGAQYAAYMNILKTNTTTPILIVHHEDFTVQRLIRLRSDIRDAALRVKRKPSLSDPAATPAEPPVPTLTVIRTGVFGAALRDLPGINHQSVAKMVEGQPGNYALLTFPSLDPPVLSAVIRTMERTVPPKPPKTQAELDAEIAAKSADPEQPGRRMKKQKKEKAPGLKIMGAIIENRVLLHDEVKDISKLPSLDTLRAQLVGLLSAPASQLAAVLNEAGGGKLARTLEGLKKGLEETENGPSA